MLFLSNLLYLMGCESEESDAFSNPPIPFADAGGSAQTPSNCVGVAVENETDAVTRALMTCSTCKGESAPSWSLNDFQPQSCGFGQSYGLQQFRGHTTLVGLFSGWCDFCLSQTVELERMRQELLMEGNDVQFVIVNSSDAASDQQKLIDRCAFPLFQDTPEVNAFGLHGGAKDDLFVYNKQGVLTAFLPGTGEAGPTVLMSEPGYENVKSAILAAE